MTTNNNNVVSLALPASNQVAALTQDLFRDIDFNGIANAIENIGNHNTGLTVEEKELALDVVNTWEKGIIQRFKDRNSEMQRFLNVFEIGNGGYIKGIDFLEESGAELAAKTNTVAEFDEMMKAYEELQDLYQLRPIEPIEREERTYQEKLDEEKDYQKDKAIYAVKVRKAERTVYLAELAWKKLVKQNKDVKEMVKRANKFSRDLGKYTGMCQDKSNLAKLNVTVSNPEVRKSLRELLDFSVTI